MEPAEDAEKGKPEVGNKQEHHQPWQMLLRDRKANEDQETTTRFGNMVAKADVTGSRFGGMAGMKP